MFRNEDSKAKYEAYIIKVQKQKKNVKKMFNVILI